MINHPPLSRFPDLLLAPIRMVGAALAILSLSFNAAGQESTGEKNESAIELFNGKDFSTWKEPQQGWSIAGDVAIVESEGKGKGKFVSQPGEGITLVSGETKGGNLESLHLHGDCRMVAEFNVAPGSNSGIYLMGRYEIQIRDSYGKSPLDVHDAGAIYERWIAETKTGYEGSVASVNACRPAGEWQTYEIWFRAPRYDEEGNKTANATFEKVIYNGVVIQENVECTGPTRGGMDETPEKGPVYVQGNHGPIAFRSLKLFPLK